MNYQSQLYAMTAPEINKQELYWKYLKFNYCTDCTISTANEGNRAINVHRIVLAAASDYLAQLFLMKITEKNPIVVFCGIDYDDLSRAIEYIYRGKVNLLEEHLDGFMRAVETLGIKNVKTGDPIESKQVPTTAEVNQSSSDSDSSSSSSSDEEKVEKKKKETKYITPPKAKRSRPISPIEIMLSRLKEKQKSQKPEKKEKIKEKIPIDKIFPCQFCQKLFRTRKTANEHQHSCQQNPNRRVFTCSVCQQSFSRKGRLTLHAKKHKDEDTGETQCLKGGKI